VNKQTELKQMDLLNQARRNLIMLINEDKKLKNQYQVIRGGAWNSNAVELFRCSDRSYYNPKARYRCRGFRFSM